ncbi:MAG: hypothetical protein GX130_12605 [Candidatus Hydrogenedens sp.]|jgi:hypothetical protein|nr:hypothetical protein [Candidatus Hydrogenedens sp.]
MPKKKQYQPGDPRQIVLWARRYAQSRTISFLVQWVFIVIMVLAIGLAAALTQTAHEQGRMGLFTLSVGVMILSALLMLWFSISRWTSDLIFSITNWLYGREGYASWSGSSGKEEPLPLWLTGLSGGLLAYHLLGALLISFNYMNIRHLQPWSALYMTPFLIIMVVYQRLGFWAWIWPVLYGIHGLLLYFGLSWRFGREYELLNIVVPIFGYGLAAILTGHLYSRYALLKLKTLTRHAIPDGEGTEEEADSGTQAGDPDNG